MFRDYEKAKRILKDSFAHILRTMDERELSYDDVKDLMVEALYELSKEKGRVQVHKVTTGPQVLYGPPPVQKEEYFTAPQVLYGPPPVQREEFITMPQVLYGPPPKTEEVFVQMPQLLYGPPKMDRVEMETMLNDDYIPGTNIRKPRDKKPNETEAEYLEYLESYYASYFPDGKGPKAR